MNAESDSRALSAIEDLVHLLQLAEGAAQRLAQEVHGPAFDHAATERLVGAELQL
jgi:hypothetical protein